MTQESLFREHWRRFFHLPQQEDALSEAVSEALFWNDQMAWSLGIIPWRAWRYSFQKSMLQYLQTHCPQEAERVYGVVNTALATAHGDYFSLPAECDRKNLLETVRTFCSKKAAEHIAHQIHFARPNSPFLGIAVLERFLQCISKKRKMRRHAQHVAYISNFLHFRVLNEFFRQADHLFTEDDAKIRDIVALSAFDILLSHFGRVKTPAFRRQLQHFFFAFG
jgi:hypothetical protein